MVCCWSISRKGCHPPGWWTRSKSVDQIKKIFQVKKAGHTGTLDPFATGLLPVALGQATRLSRFFLGSAKHYRAVVTLGIETDTLDKTGRVTFQADPDLVSSILPEQVPPVFPPSSTRAGRFISWPGRGR